MPARERIFTFTIRERPMAYISSLFLRIRRIRENAPPPIPEFIEDDIFKTIIPLRAVTTQKITQKKQRKGLLIFCGNTLNMIENK
jgi:hypothetical protein